MFVVFLNQQEDLQTIRKIHIHGLPRRNLSLYIIKLF